MHPGVTRSTWVIARWGGIARRSSPQTHAGPSSSMVRDRQAQAQSPRQAPVPQVVLSDSEELLEQDREEGELSGEEIEVTQMQPRLFAPEVFQPLLSKACRVLQLPEAEAGGDAPTQSASAGAKKAFPSMDTKQVSVPFPQAFDDVWDAEWSSPCKPKPPAKWAKKHYVFADRIMARLRFPTVDPPIAALASSAVIPTEGEGGPKDQCDKRVEGALCRSFEADAVGFRAAATSSVFSRAVFMWAEEFGAWDDVPKFVKDGLNKMAYVSALSADASMDALQFAARSMAASTVARRNIWLRQWPVDSGSQTRLTALPFSGSKLFGEPLEAHLVETRDKKKALPMARREERKGRQNQFFCSSKQLSRFRSQHSNRLRWGRQDKGGGHTSSSKPGGTPFSSGRNQKGVQKGSSS
ncbi:uncharacterized protein LOC133379752 [Rhineura floridana]|uniref:uncharacterized protein LOC133379752 n=1 Tax=Rhineura floridana TaxID=261503 RepID=UPI002AC80FBA|nr:uncharacterized protein LOC133379752 [Rhineura floridana]